MPTRHVMSRKLSAFEVGLCVLGAGLAFAAIASGHERWIEVAAPAAIVAGFLVEPLLIFAHEFGHALAAVALTRRRVHIQMGEPPFAVRFAMGKISVDYAPGGYVAHCEFDPSTLTPRGLFVTSLAGPLASVMLGLGLAWSAVERQDHADVLFWILALAAGGSLLLGVANAIPFRHLPGWWPGAMRLEEGPSDGYLALLALRTGLRSGGGAVSPPPASTGMTERARRVVATAGDAARMHQSDNVGTGHLLLGLLREQDGMAARVLRSCGLATADVEVGLRRDEEAPAHRSAMNLVLTPAAKRALRRAKDTLTLRGDEQIDTEHILLGLIQEPQTSAVQMVSDQGVDATKVRQAVLRFLSGDGR